MTGKSLSEIIIFMAVAEAGSFARGGEALGLTGSAASKAVARLEARLGVRLMHRTSRALSLTSEGERFRDSGRAILEAIDQAEASVATPSGIPQGLLRLSVPDAFGRKIIMPLVARYLEKWPDVRIDIDVSDRLVDLVEEGFDLAVRIGGESAPAGIVSRVIADYPVRICAAPSYLERRGYPSHPESLSQHDCLLFRSGTRTQEWFGQSAGATRERLPTAARLRMNSAEAIYNAVSAGLGIALLPSFLIDEDLAARRLVHLFPDMETGQVKVVCLFPSRRLVDPRVRAFIDHLTAELRRSAQGHDQRA